MTTLFDVQSTASHDQTLHAALQARPRETLAQAGLDVPQETDISVLVSTVKDLHIALPPYIGPDGPLTDEQIEAANGGASAAVITGIAWTARAIWGLAIGGGTALSATGAYHGSRAIRNALR